MPSWGEILVELNGLGGDRTRYDIVRRKYLSELAKYTGRSTIIYATNWLNGRGEPGLTSIVPEDIHAFMEVVHGLPVNSGLDIILHSPGGQVEAADAIVQYLRSKFDDIRVIVPHAAMSAATMLACASDRILMGRHSFLGPIDPQFLLKTQVGPAWVPAYAILEQFKMAQDECREQAKLPSWMPILGMYGPALLVQCRLAQQLSQQLVECWLSTYMFKGRRGGKKRAAKIAAELADHGDHKSHGRFLGLEKIEQLGLVVEHLEAISELQDLVLSVFHSISHTFNATPSTKIVESHLGAAFIKRAQVPSLLIQPGFQLPAFINPPGTHVPDGPPSD